MTNRSASTNRSSPVLFAALLCLLMLVGEMLPVAGGNPMSLVFYSFLPAALWMIARERKREADEIQTLKARLDELERTLRNQPPS